MEPITSEEIVRLLNDNIRSEHAAIVQYQYHAFLTDDYEIKHEIEETAREEMRHLLWFAEAIVKLGGKPVLERDNVFPGTDLADRLAKDLEDERMAVEEYAQQRERVEEPWIKRLLGRVLSDEEAHRERFERLSAKARAQSQAISDASVVPELSGESAPAPPAPDPVDPVRDLLNQDIRREYTAILQYLDQSFTTPSCEVGKEMLMIAQEEMKHLAWLAEPLVDRGEIPQLEWGELYLDPSTPEMLQRDIQSERNAEAQYLHHREAISDPEIQRVLARIEREETYQRERLEGLLAEMENEEKEEGKEKEVPSEPENWIGRLTVGSLFRQAME
ncbi:MAG: hypothetical protein HYY20_09545 [Candidatus Tectomicrobia bacterium]|uniref:Ferritin/DPS domain-containing protein n=1 Tax=Tectimicrobiota bacterium TaxID=2528274 RepID=A0A932CPV4_UNCTE|nr:hypothetical protein [Candidatus Tectomicrobia bacterium]